MGISEPTKSSIGGVLNAVTDKVSDLMGSDGAAENKSSRGYVRGDTSLVRSNVDGGGSDLVSKESLLGGAFSIDVAFLRLYYLLSTFSDANTSHPLEYLTNSRHSAEMMGHAP